MLVKRYWLNSTASQRNKVEFKCDRVVPNDSNGFDRVLTNNLVSIGSLGQKHFDLK